MKTVLRKLVVPVIALGLIMPVLAAQAASPVTMLKGIARNILVGLEKNQSRLRGPRGASIVYGLVSRYLFPYVNMGRAAAMTVGGDYWNKASSSQKQVFIRLYKRRLVATYSAALRSYDDDAIRFYPLRHTPGSTVVVKSLLIRKNGRRIPISYNLMSSGSSWKVYDMSIENVSMVNSFRSQFRPILARSGMNGLIKQLQRG